MFNLYQRVERFLFKDLWQLDPTQYGRLKGDAIKLLRLLFVLGREMFEGQLALRAMSLVYTTLLSLVPLLAVSFSVLKAFGVHNQIEPLLSNFLAPLGPQGEELTQRVLAFVENVKVGVLGSVGLVFLIYTVVTLIQKIEESFNYVWRIHRIRSVSRRFSDYLSVILIGPVLVFSAIGVTASIRSTALVQRILEIEPFGTVIVLLGNIMPFVLVISAFTFIYIFVPNTRVHLRSALVGGTIAGIAWQSTGFLFASFVATSVRYEALYSGFAIIILSMIWLYLSWLILLFGSQVAYYNQHPQQIRLSSGRFRMSCRLKEKLGLIVMYMVSERYTEGGRPWSVDALVDRLRFPGDALEDVVCLLVEANMLVEVGEDPVTYLPARDPDTITLRELFSVLRGAEEARYSAEAGQLDVAAIRELVGEVDRSRDDTLRDMTLKQLVRRGEEE